MKNAPHSCTAQRVRSFASVLGEPALDEILRRGLLEEFFQGLTILNGRSFTSLRMEDQALVSAKTAFLHQRDMPAIRADEHPQVHLIRFKMDTLGHAERVTQELSIVSVDELSSAVIADAIFDLDPLMTGFKVFPPAGEAAFQQILMGALFCHGIRPHQQQEAAQYTQDDLFHQRCSFQ